MTTIGELASRHSVTLRTIRFYEQKGMLSPRREGEGEHKPRIYSEADASKLAAILDATALGFTLKEIPALLKQDASGWSLAIPDKMMRKQLELMHTRMIETTSAVNRLQAMVMGKRYGSAA